MRFKKTKIGGLLVSFTFLLSLRIQAFADDSLMSKDSAEAIKHIRAWQDYVSTQSVIWDIFRLIGWGIVKFFFSINQALADFMTWYISPAKGIFSILSQGSSAKASVSDQIAASPFAFLFFVGTAVIVVGVTIAIALNAFHYFTGKGRPVNELIMTLLKNAGIIMLAPYMLMFGLLIFQSLSSAVGFTNSTTTDANGLKVTLASQMIGNNLIDAEDANAQDLPIYGKAKYEEDTTIKGNYGESNLNPFRLIPIGAIAGSGYAVGSEGGVEAYTKPSDIYNIDINQIVKNSPYNSDNHTSTDWVHAAHGDFGSKVSDFFSSGNADVDKENLIIYTARNIDLNENPNPDKKASYYLDSRTSGIPSISAGVYVWHVSWLPIIIGEFALTMVYIFAIFKIAKIAWEFINLLILGIPTGAVKIGTEEGARFILDETFEMLLSLFMTVIGVNMFIGFSTVIGTLVSGWQASGMYENLLKSVITPILLLMFAGFSREDPRFWRASGAMQGNSNMGMTTRGLVGSMMAMNAAKSAIGGVTRLGKNVVGSDIKGAMQRSAAQNGGKTTIGGTLANLRGARAASFMGGKVNRGFQEGMNAYHKSSAKTARKNAEHHDNSKGKIKAAAVGLGAGIISPGIEAAGSIRKGSRNFGKTMMKNTSVAKRTGASEKMNEAVRNGDDRKLEHLENKAKAKQDAVRYSIPHRHDISAVRKANKATTRAYETESKIGLAREYAAYVSLPPKAQKEMRFEEVNRHPLHEVNVDSNMSLPPKRPTKKY
ncbi:hypothetical protein [Lactococcus allomyrinae]|uniref:DUF8208 domain-containing protein n=1 Tax=Lactococcus allomyrinae TaxID=2419773 RepID=A0A387BCT5_9LACT|nr:hypothetical protein [Lactococcus allomyrinae]AYF99831.1 hypothetical protein D7I46_01265 [Lactococcus allomyrinae]